jgi:hypothetical protein
MVTAPLLVRESSQRAEQPVDGSSSRQLIHPPQGGKHARCGALSLAVVWDDLQIPVWSRRFDAGKHTMPPKNTATIMMITKIINQNFLSNPRFLTPHLGSGPDHASVFQELASPSAGTKECVARDSRVPNKPPTIRWL